MRHLKSTLAVIGAVAVLVLAGNTIAIGATGQGFLLGRSNSADTMSTLKRTTAGPPLRITAKAPTNAPLSTNARGKVTNLNADKVDGLDSTALRTRSYVYSASYSAADYVQVDVPVPPGATYLVSYSAPIDNLGTAGIACYIRQAMSPSSFSRTGYSAFNHTAGEFIPALTGSGVVTRTFDGAIAVICESSDDDLFDSGEYGMQIVATPTQVAGKSALPALELPE